MKKVLPFLLSTVVLFSCKEKKEDMIMKNWQAVSLENLQMDSVLKQQQIFIDTVGSHTDPSENVSRYGVSDLDSLRQELKMQLDGYKEMQKKAIEATQFNFKKDSLALINFGGGSIDTCKWYFDKDGSLILIEKRADAGDKIKMEVMQLNNDGMKLKIKASATESTVTFKPAKK